MKLNIYIAYNPAILLLGMWLRETTALIHQETCSKMFVIALLHSSKNLETMKLKGEMDKYITLLCYAHTIKCSTTVKTNEHKDRDDS